ncbi:hypothetical protein DSO57_1033073 [Entomophthora muscae]|uniref:Uncharacterized protein n=1 Tax=Entomophthora muscae TaxID=34485 RepID=A0ACC2U9P4_9FUNG|nr:hypothetical protein DSO57_1033073 [Entomophthora muscae]
MNDISILVLKTWELKPGSHGKPYVDQSRQEIAQLLAGSSPGPPEIDDPKQGEQKPAKCQYWSGWEPAHLLNCKPELRSYSETRQSPEDNSPNSHQIAANLVPPKILIYAEVVACLKEVKTKPTVNSANDHQHLPAFCDVVNSGGGKKHCHFYSPEQAQPGSAALKTLSQDPCPTSALSANLNPEKIEEAKTHVIFHLNSGQVDHQTTTPSGDQPANPPQALYCPPGAPFEPVHFTKYPPNPAYTEYNLETILIADPLSRTRETEYIGHEGKRIKALPLLFKDKYNYLPAYFFPMTLPRAVLAPKRDDYSKCCNCPVCSSPSTSFGFPYVGGIQKFIKKEGHLRPPFLQTGQKNINSKNKIVFKIK